MTDDEDKKTLEYEGRDLETMAFAENYHRWILDQFEGFIGNDVVEVGAGSGSLAKMLAQISTANVHAIEPSNEMFPLLQDVAGSDLKITCEKAFLSDMKSRDNIDTFMYVNVMEHIEFDGDEVAQVYKRLESGGNLLIYVPALPVLYSEFDRSIDHYRRYTKASLRSLLESNGFQVKKLHYCDFFGIAPWYVRFKILKSKSIPPKQVEIFDKYFVPVLKRIERYVTAPIGKNLVAIGHKSE